MYVCILKIGQDDRKVYTVCPTSLCKNGQDFLDTPYIYCICNGIMTQARYISNISVNVYVCIDVDDGLSDVWPKLADLSSFGSPADGLLTLTGTLPRSGSYIRSNLYSNENNKNRHNIHSVR